jgi:hypothetical protein
VDIRRSDEDPQQLTVVTQLPETPRGMVVSKKA